MNDFFQTKHKISKQYHLILINMYLFLSSMIGNDILYPIYYLASEDKNEKIIVAKKIDSD